MVDVKFTMNGREVPLDRIGGELEKAVVSRAEEEMKKRVGRVHCSEHHQYARMTRSGSSGAEFTIKGCCQRLVEEATRALK